MARRDRPSTTAGRPQWSLVLQGVGLTLLVVGTVLMIVLALQVDPG